MNTRLLTFNGENDGELLVAVVVRRAHDVFALVVEDAPFDFQLVVVSIVALRMLGGLTKFDVAA